jgi:hypothetical protein
MPESLTLAFSGPQTWSSNSPLLVTDQMTVAMSRPRSSRARGLGLSIASQVIARHGGAIDAAAGEERGTTVTLQLPLAPVQRQEDPAAVSAQPLSSKRRLPTSDFRFFPRLLAMSVRSNHDVAIESVPRPPMVRTGIVSHSGDAAVVRRAGVRSSTCADHHHASSVGGPRDLVVKQLSGPFAREADVYEALWNHLERPPAVQMFGRDVCGDATYLYLEHAPSFLAWP